MSSLSIKVESFDVPRIASVYGDTSGNRWWTKAWFNNKEKGEKAIEISRDMAIKFIQDVISKDDWLARFYPTQMVNYQNVMFNTRKQLLGL